MSYQSRKRKKAKLNKLKFFIGLVWVKFFDKIRKTIRRKKSMRLPGTKKVMGFLRARNKIIRPNNLRINEWVDEYLDKCLLNGQPVNILTPWSLSKALERRFEQQDNKFMSTKKERDLFRKGIPQVIETLEKNGFRLNWWVPLSRSYLDNRLIGRELENSYKRMIVDLAKEFNLCEKVLFLDWEDDVLGGRAAPDARVLENFGRYVSPGAFEVELQRWRKWAQEQAGLEQNEEELEKDVRYQIACEAEEGRFLMGDESPFGPENFIVIPLEMPERFESFTIFAPDFKKRIVSVLSPYPWRL